MTKQEEIREGMAKWLTRYFKYGWEQMDEGHQNQKLDEAQSLMSYLHSQGIEIVKYPKRGDDLTGTHLVWSKPLIEGK